MNHHPISVLDLAKTAVFAGAEMINRRPLCSEICSKNVCLFKTWYFSREIYFVL